MFGHLSICKQNYTYTKLKCLKFNFALNDPKRVDRPYNKPTNQPTNQPINKSKNENSFMLKEARPRRYPTETMTDADYADDLVLHVHVLAHHMRATAGESRKNP